MNEERRTALLGRLIESQRRDDERRRVGGGRAVAASQLGEAEGGGIELDRMPDRRGPQPWQRLAAMERLAELDAAADADRAGGATLAAQYEAARVALLIGLGMPWSADVIAWTPSSGAPCPACEDRVERRAACLVCSRTEGAPSRRRRSAGRRRSWRNACARIDRCGAARPGSPGGSGAAGRRRGRPPVRGWTGAPCGPTGRRAPPTPGAPEGEARRRSASAGRRVCGSAGPRRADLRAGRQWSDPAGPQGLARGVAEAIGSARGRTHGGATEQISGRGREPNRESLGPPRREGSCAALRGRRSAEHDRFGVRGRGHPGGPPRRDADRPARQG